MRTVLAVVFVLLSSLATAVATNNIFAGVAVLCGFTAFALLLDERR